jgi:DNA invertase Pin-like site-specific DNA recombinase
MINRTIGSNDETGNRVDQNGGPKGSEARINPMNERIIAYYRVSTQRQGQSGLGLEGQRAAVESYSRGVGAIVVASFTEVESGKSHQNRPQLARALAQAKAMRATIVVAKLDRLARNVAFLSALLESGSPFVACDNPHATKLTIHILAAVAEDELSRISARLKAAFTAGKARGRVYGGQNPNCQRFTRQQALKGSASARGTNIRLAREFRATLRPIAQAMRDAGKTCNQIASEMNSAGYATRRGKPWTIATVSALLNLKFFEKEIPL